MDYFLLYPDYDIVNKYYQIQETREGFQQLCEGGYQFSVINAYRTGNGEPWLMDEHVDIVASGFKELLQTHGIGQIHYSNLLYICLKELDNTGAVTLYDFDVHDHKVRAQQIANLILTYRNTPKNRLQEFRLKTLTETVKVADANLVSWICSLVDEAFKTGTIPQEIVSLELPLVSDADLQRIAFERIPRQDLSYKKYWADICFSVYRYLVEETNINGDENLFSNDMLRFYFDALVLFKLIDPDNINSDEPDYMRSVLMNQIRRLNV